MLVSAIFASMILMSTAAMMSDIQDSSFEPSTMSYDLDNIRRLGHELDLAKKSDRKRFAQALSYIPSYSTNLNYWSRKRCYNISMSNTQTDLQLTCVGNGSVFNDAFEDGDYQDPAWLKSSTYGSAEIKSRYTPGSGYKVLRLQENSSAGGSSFKMLVDNPVNEWDSQWRASGAFYLDEYNTSISQRHNIYLNYNESETDYIRASVGFSDSSGNDVEFRILDEGIISSSSYGSSVNWQEDTWYHWSIQHTGSGNYEGRIWREGASRPSSPSTEASGGVPSGWGKMGLQMDGTDGQEFVVDHAFMKLRKQ